MGIDLTALRKIAPSLCNVVPNKDRELHIDGDYAAYYYSGNDNTSLWEGRQAMTDAILSITNSTGCGQVILHLTSPGSDKGKRYRIATVKPYQGQRDTGRKPKNWYGMRAWLEGGALGGLPIQVRTWDDREADDGVALAAQDCAERGAEAFILSRDKDFRMIPGVHVVWTTHQLVPLPPGTFAKKGVDDKWYGDLWFWLQMLMGDTADNIPGLEKYIGPKGTPKTVGDKTAEKLLVGTLNNAEAFDLVYNLYVGYYGSTGADRFVEQASLLWMRGDLTARVDDFLKVVPTPVPAALHHAITSLRDRIDTPDS